MWEDILVVLAAVLIFAAILGFTYLTVFSFLEYIALPIYNSYKTGNSQLRKEVYYNEEVWVNVPMEDKRKGECLCLKCGNMKPGQPDHCQYAAYFYEGCKKGGCAFIMTRCREWKPKPAKDDDNSHFNNQHFE